ncbi:hypothetical protein OIU34_19290 [Pararhizobium sp. BT-229]|uniref:hypothetical protein n=1 Tax=Pararhizobium sp. BT-229 TaxID=2986923 RepID=UPI0021F754FC|nr:hypothetical protein [Pararhizobium sp. BT-229]MCV9964028.1 hypothetical protein [Pararhizobium sp. BT-229]
MKIRARYPALVEGRVKRMTGDRLILCLPEDEFQFREVPSQDAPVALVVKQHGATIQYRMLEGKLYTLLPRMPDHMKKAAELNPDCTVLKGGHPLFGGMADEITEIVRKREANETRPDRLLGILANSFISTEVTDRAIADAGAIVATERSLAGLEFWRAKAKSRIAEIILIDGKEWVVTPEPAYKLHVDFGRVDAQHSDIYDQGSLETGRWRDFDWEHMRYRYFSANDLDTARRTLANLCEGREFVVDGNIEVILPEAIRNDYAGLEIDRAARVCVRKLEKHLDTTGSKHPEELRAFPRQPIMAACHLRDALVGRNPFHPVDDSLAAALETFIDVMERHPELVSEMSFTDELSSVRDALDIWCDREIALSLGSMNAPTPTM